ncbi:MAG: hypothetical protein H6741_28470 [Alphaproteobacteria bacterium]|nr:hypothetical protein [Alphaproteobacteria bacterium]MCB9796652.1 hypothetical protein [Alphaproteobacteria bacterium]
MGDELDKVKATDGAAQGRPGELIVVLGAKGGCGATLVATNLAAWVAQERPCALVDLDYCKGGIAGALDLWPERDLHDVLDEGDRLDPEMLRGYACAAGEGLSALTQPHDLTELDQVSRGEIERLLEVARRAWPVVVADCGSRVDAATLTAAMAADRILLVLTPSLSALRDGKRVLNLLDGLGVSPSAVSLVVNQSRRSPPVTVDELVRRLEAPLAGELRRDEAAAAKAEFEGRPLREVAPLTHLGRDLESLASRLVLGDIAPVAPMRRWHFGFGRS